MDKEHLKEILENLHCIRDGLLDDSSLPYAAYNLGMLTASIEIILDLEEQDEDFGHT